MAALDRIKRQQSGIRGQRVRSGARGCLWAILASLPACRYGYEVVELGAAASLGGSAGTPSSAITTIGGTSFSKNTGGGTVNSIGGSSTSSVAGRVGGSVNSSAAAVGGNGGASTSVSAVSQGGSGSNAGAFQLSAGSIASLGGNAATAASGAGSIASLGGRSNGGNSSVSGGTYASSTGAGTGGLAPLGSFAGAVLVTLPGARAYEQDPSFTLDATELYFTAPNGAYDAIWVSTRVSAIDAWGTPALAATFNTKKANTSKPAVSGDGLTLYFASDRQESGGNDIWRSTRATRKDAWATPSLVTELGSASWDYGAVACLGDTFVLLSSLRSGASTIDLFYSTRASSAVPWTVPVPALGLNSSADDWDTFTADGLTVVLSSARGGNVDLYVSTRATLSSAFGEPVPLSEINSSNDDGDPWLTLDLRYIMFASNRSGTMRLYESRR